MRGRSRDVVLTHAPWRSVTGLRHGFLDRGECAGDGPWGQLLARVGVPLPIDVPRQVHGTLVRTASDGDRPEADGLATTASGRLVGILTADCVPVLMVDAERRIAAAVHAGWRGMSAGVLEAALEHLRTQLGSRPGAVEAVIGPAVGGCCYEVGAEVRAAFQGRTGALTEPAWTLRDGRTRVDLRLAGRLLLEAAGVSAVHQLGPCTVCTPAYCSYRRDGPGAGRQLSFVGWA